MLLIQRAVSLQANTRYPAMLSDILIKFIDSGCQTVAFQGAIRVLF